MHTNTNINEYWQIIFVICSTIPKQIRPCLLDLHGYVLFWNIQWKESICLQLGVPKAPKFYDKLFFNMTWCIIHEYNLSNQINYTNNISHLKIAAPESSQLLSIPKINDLLSTLLISKVCRILFSRRVLNMMFMFVLS